MEQRCLERVMKNNPYSCYATGVLKLGYPEPLTSLVLHTGGGGVAKGFEPPCYSPGGAEPRCGFQGSPTGEQPNLTYAAYSKNRLNSQWGISFMRVTITLSRDFASVATVALRNQINQLDLLPLGRTLKV